MQRLISSLRQAVPTGLEEITEPARTLTERSADILAHFDRPGTSNGPTPSGQRTPRAPARHRPGIQKPHPLHHPQPHPRRTPQGPPDGNRLRIRLAPPTTPSNAKSRFTTYTAVRGHDHGDHPRSRGVYGHGGRHLQSADGSSPRARGLLGSFTLIPIQCRIIPARAGFTVSIRRDGKVSRDHPRSRGVYSGTATPKNADKGSSPLARGLLGGDLSRRPGLRIIPARAGFTWWRCWRRPRRADHPRSRGVYDPAGTADLDDEGSSPLARGLRGAIPSVRRGSRIIPARAGFTSTPSPSSSTARDHPRSRGVYASDNLARASENGSSPLARGLRRRHLRAYHGPRIIPARAGFTAVPPGGVGAGQDHPRSRGVYECSMRSGSRTSGSSPLARGLRRRNRSRASQTRIIPARAGFTVGDALEGAGRKDHPRSRGVYLATVAHDAVIIGSSPLARGLPSQGHRGLRQRRIIPARAGFTAPTISAACPMKDHPRSRGVYSAGSAGASCPTGIIPARAGFTNRFRIIELRQPDHPRSRGVYRVTPGPNVVPGGSSPLARGLRVQRIDIINRPGIIPARAGFTITRLVDKSASADHPRSRGVYDLGVELLLGQWWIIPARAGFTAGRSKQERVSTDHPRSRGVYHAPSQRASDFAGSSPLARGLLGPWSSFRFLSGIIPARAGFTAIQRCYSPEYRDHPRSRGVYCAWCAMLASRGGSSPLARGLHAIMLSEVIAEGIIPARAGFTLNGILSLAARRDHPRSRGVYLSMITGVASAGGSSPLARGLRRFPRVNISTSRIIPARAGFTLLPTLITPLTRDHPRSRGVYNMSEDLRRNTGGSSPLARGLPDHAHGTVGDGRIIPARAGFTGDVS